MSNLTSVINVNVPSEVKEEATNLFNSLGLNMSTAINIFLKKAIFEIFFQICLTMGIAYCNNSQIHNHM